MKRSVIVLAIALLPLIGISQSAKVQTAWRAISDYESTLKDGKPDLSSLMKAKENIDLASENPDTKEKAKTWLYKAKVYYYLFKNNLKTEQDKLTTITDKNEKIETAYGNVDTTAYTQAFAFLDKAQKLDKDKVYEMDMGMLGAQMVPDINNLAIGKFKVKKYGEAMDFFEASYDFTKQAFGKKDTSILYNAVIAAQKAKNYDKVKEFDKKMIDDKIANTYTYQSLFDAKIATADTAGALQTLKDGRVAFPNDTYLMNRETEFYLQQGKQQEALSNLDKAIEKDPKNAQLYLVRGNVFDNLANPKDGANKDKEKPKNYEELMLKAEVDYSKAAELSGSNFDVWYNLGALYNNWAGYYQTKADNSAKAAQEQKANEAKAQDLFKKAITPLEKALELKPDDKGSMYALRKLYLMTNQPEKATKMSERMKK